MMSVDAPLAVTFMDLPGRVSNRRTDHSSDVRVIRWITSADTRSVP
ncbi:hypothetical protein Pd630_LPD07160 [Rhodococcus opacus PD630]|nr:hypothetical protein Pd630_LPD07160 [Rhodococcus opacus PD630]